MEMSAVMQAPVKVQDYILKVDVEKPLASTYEIVLQNNSDFVISRKTQRSERELVILISQGLYYIRDKKTNSIDSLTLQGLKTFLRDLKDSIALEKVNWLPCLVKGSAELIDGIISDEVLVDMCRHDALTGVSEPSWYRRFWLRNSKLFIQLCALFPTIADTDKYRPCIPFIYEIHDKLGYNEAMYFAEQLVQSGIRGFSPSRRTYRQTDGFMELLDDKTYNLQFRRFTDFLLFDLFSQGIAKIGSDFWAEYADFLNMQIKFYGKIVEKYPKYFKTMHDIITLKFNTLQEAEQCQNFEERAKEIEHLAYKGREYSIIVPHEPQELAEEGVALSHCVRDYIGRVANGECHILFLRYTATPNVSLVTVQLSGKTVCQAQGQNRRGLSSEERKFLYRWAQANNFDVTV